MKHSHILAVTLCAVAAWGVYGSSRTLTLVSAGDAFMVQKVPAGFSDFPYGRENFFRGGAVPVPDHRNADCGKRVQPGRMAFQKVFRPCLDIEYEETEHWGWQGSNF